MENTKPIIRDEADLDRRVDDYTDFMIRGAIKLRREQGLKELNEEEIKNWHAEARKFVKQQFIETRRKIEALSGM